jgi:hypothetical protein
MINGMEAKHGFDEENRFTREAFVNWGRMGGKVGGKSTSINKKRASKSNAKRAREARKKKAAIRKN